MSFKNKLQKSTSPGILQFRILIPAIVMSAAVSVTGGLYSITKAGPFNTFFTDKYLLSSIFFSLQTAFVSTLISAVSGTAGAILIWSLFKDKRTSAVIYIIPMIVPHILAAFFIQVFFSQTGLISSVFHNAGLIKSAGSFPLLVFDQSGIGIILSYFYKESAFITLVVLASLRKLPPDLIDTALMLGRNRTALFRKIIFPHISLSLETGLLIIFIYTFGAYDIPFLAGSSSNPMVAVKAYTLFFKGSLNERAEASALIFMIWFISIICLLVFFLIRKPVRRWIKGE